MSRKFILFREVDDPIIRENFRRVSDFFREDPLTKATFDFVSYDLKATTYPATVSVAHTFDFVPKDVITTSVVGGDLIWEYAQFTRSLLFATISAPLTVRAFVGSYAEGRIV